MPLYYPRTTPTFDVVSDFGAVGNMRTTFDGACSTGAPTKITSATMAFTSADVGLRITLAQAGLNNVMYQGTITAVDSATQVTVSPNIVNTVSTRGLSIGTDDTTAFQNALNSLTGSTSATAGGALFVPETATNRFMITNTLTASGGGWVFEGIGRATTTDAGDYTKSGGTWLCWNGASSSIMLLITPVVSAASVPVQAPILREMSLDCRNGDQSQALIGIRMLSTQGYNFSNFYINDALAVGLDLNVVTGTLGQAKDTTRGTFQNATIRELDKDPAVTLGSTTTTGAGTFSTTPFSLAITAGTNFTTSGFVWVASNLGYPVLVTYTGGGGTTTLTGCTVEAFDTVNAPTWVAGANVVQCSPSNACCIRLNGDTGANACCGTIDTMQLSHGTTWGPAAIEFLNSDSIMTRNVYINGGSATNDGAINRIRKPGVRLNGSNTNATLASRNNTFYDGSAGAGGVNVMGSLNTGVRMSAISGPHYWNLYQLGNAEGLPVVENGAYFDWQPNGGWRLGQRGQTAITNQAITANTLTMVSGSTITVPPQGFQIGTAFRWTITGRGAAAGTATNTFAVKIGTAGGTADANVAAMTTTAGTAAASEFVTKIIFTVRTLGAAATADCETTILNSAAAGFINATVNVLSGTMSTFNSTTAQQFINVSLTSGTGKNVTIKQVVAECINPSNP